MDLTQKSFNSLSIEGPVWTTKIKSINTAVTLQVQELFIHTKRLNG